MRRAGHVTSHAALRRTFRRQRSTSSAAIRRHTSRRSCGIYNYTSDSSYIVDSLSHRKYKPRDLLDIAFSKEPSFGPGAPGKWEYSNTNYVILGMIIESVTGKDVAQVLRERILTPIGAKATFFNGSEPLIGDVAYGRSFLGTNGATFLDPSAAWCAGNIVATIGDVVDWAEKRGSGSFHSAAMRNGPAIGHGGDTVGYHLLVYYFPNKKATIAVIVDSDKGPTSSFPFGATYLEDMYMTVVNPYFGTTPQ